MLSPKTSLFIFLILCDITWFINCQEYLKELKAKAFRYSEHNELSPVELPRPIVTKNSDIALNDELMENELIKYPNRLGKSRKPTLMDVALEVSVREGLNAMKHLYMEIEPNMIKNGQLLQDDHPAALLSKFSAPLVDTSQREMAAYATLAATKVFRENYDLSNDWARQAHSQKVSLRRTALESMCPPREPPICMPATERYRTHDGTCNNKRRLRWGAAQMPFNRFLPPEYGDSVDTIRKAMDGGQLPSARFVSLLVHGARDGEAPLTLMLAQWGQLLDHDLTSTAQPRSINGSVPSCCGSKNFHPSCFPIKVPLDDPWLSPLNVRCLEFLRSAPAQRRDCVLSWREQTNQATSYIDASPIYSSNVKASDIARVFSKGLLIFGRGNPVDDVCQRGAISTHCIRSGDGRSGEQPGLLALHHVWVHEHNHIAMKLSEMNLHWSDEKIYQETRRIIGAIFQHITYREFLPIVLGREVLKLFDLELQTSGYYEGYDPKTNPTVANAFAAAAFRFGHSLVQNSYMRCDRFHNVINNNVSLHEEFQRGDIGSVGSLHRLLRGMATQRALKRDEFITPELTNHLFQTPGFPFGLDLAAINIQRGRDHGIPPYVHWRAPCGLSPINTWEELAHIVGPESAQRISHAYESVHDIDLFVGGLAERPVAGGLVGPTFACIIAQQFSNSRKGDRFWYENAGFESSFTPAQLHAIRQVSLASVLCRAVGGGTFQPHIFLPPQFPNNERLPCGVTPLADFDIDPWLEQDPFSSQSSPPTFKPETPPTTFKPHTLPDRIFNIMELETKSPDNKKTPFSENKVGFSNRHPSVTLVKDRLTQVNKRPHIDFVMNPSDGFPITKIPNKLNDKLDLRPVRTKGHVTKLKQKPSISNKLDQNNRKGGNKHSLIQATTRRTIIINNVSLEVRTAGGDISNTESMDADNKPEPRTGDMNIVSDTEKTDTKNTKGNINDLKSSTEPNDIEGKTTQVIIEKKDNGELELKLDTEQNIKKQDNFINKEISYKSHDSPTSTETKFDKLEPNELRPKIEKGHISFKDIININISSHRPKPQLNQEDVQAGEKDLKESNSHSSKLQKQTDVVNNILTISQNLQDNELKHLNSSFYSNKDLYDSDIDPMMQAIPLEHKRVQRKLIPPGLTGQLKNILKHIAAKNETTANNKQNVTTKPPTPNRTTVPPVELRQYQNRPSLTKTPQKVIVESVNGDNQYQIQINIRQANKTPKPQLSTPHVLDYTNRFKPNQLNRYTTHFQTTPIHAYYQPAPTQISTLSQNQRTKPPTIIFVNEHEEHSSTKLPGFLQNVVGWNFGTKRPLPASIGFSERPNFESIIGSPHSTANIKPSNSELPPSASSFSQAQLNSQGIVQASSASISNGNFGSIVGFANANGADSTFSFNIRHKPDRTQDIRPTANGQNYGIGIPQRNPWYEQNYPIAQHISNYDLPYKENVNSPFSTSNLQKHFVRNKPGSQLKEAFTLTPDHAVADYDYAGRTLQPSNNITTNEEIEESSTDYEYDDDYVTSPLLRNFNKDGYLRPELMIETILKPLHDPSNLTKTDNTTLDDNYVLPVLNSTKDFRTDLPTPINANLSSELPDALGKHINVDILAENDTTDTDKRQRNSKITSRLQTHSLRDLQRKKSKNRKNNNIRNQAKIAFAPINILTRPERPDNWVFYDSPRQDESSLPQVPELNVDLMPSVEIPKPLKENIWLDLSGINREITSEFNGLVEDANIELKPDSTSIKNTILTSTDASETVINLDKQTKNPV